VHDPCQKPGKSVNSHGLELKFHFPPGSRVAVEAAPAFAAAKPGQHEVTSHPYLEPLAGKERALLLGRRHATSKPR